MIPCETRRAATHLSHSRVPKGGLLHTRCMLERAERLVQATNNREVLYLVPCRVMWPTGCQPRYLGVISRGTEPCPMLGGGGQRRRVLCSSPIYPKGIPPLYPLQGVMTSVHGSFDHVMSGRGESSTSALALCMGSAVLLACLGTFIENIPARNHREGQPPAIVDCSTPSRSTHRTSYYVSELIIIV